MKRLMKHLWWAVLLATLFLGSLTGWVVRGKVEQRHRMWTCPVHGCKLNDPAADENRQGKWHVVWYCEVEDHPVEAWGLSSGEVPPGCPRLGKVALDPGKL